MISNSSHIISRLKWDTQVSERQISFELQNRLSDWSNTTMVNEVQQLFDEICPENQSWRIERVELDLGKLDYNNLEKELSYRLLESLSEQLSTLLVKSSSENVGLEIFEEELTDIQIVTFFLHNGFLPWYNTSKGRSINQIVTEIFQSKRKATNEALKELVKSINIRKRMVWQFETENIKNVIQGIEPSNSEFIFSFSTSINKIQKEENIVKTNTTEFGKGIWLWILNHLVDERGTLFNKVEFVKSSLSQMASHYNVSYDSILTLIIKATKKNKMYASSNASLFAALKVLEGQTQLDVRFEDSKSENLEIALSDELVDDFDGSNFDLKRTEKLVFELLDKISAGSFYSSDFVQIQKLWGRVVRSNPKMVHKLLNRSMNGKQNLSVLPFLLDEYQLQVLLKRVKFSSRSVLRNIVKDLGRIDKSSPNYKMAQFTIKQLLLTQFSGGNRLSSISKADDVKAVLVDLMLNAPRRFDRELKDVLEVVTDRNGISNYMKDEIFSHLKSLDSVMDIISFSLKYLDRFQDRKREILEFLSKKIDERAIEIDHLYRADIDKKLLSSLLPVKLNKLNYLIDALVRSNVNLVEGQSEKVHRASLWILVWNSVLDLSYLQSNPQESFLNLVKKSIQFKYAPASEAVNVVSSKEAFVQTGFLERDVLKAARNGLVSDSQQIRIKDKEINLNLYLIELFKHSPSQLESLLKGLHLNEKLVDRIKKCIDSESFLKLIKKNVQFENAFLAENITEVDSKDSADSPTKVDSNALGIVKEGLIRDAKYVQINGKETDLNLYLIELFKHSPSQLESLLNGLSLNDKLVDRIKNCIDSESFLKLIKKNVQFENSFLAKNSTEVDSKDSADSPTKVDSNTLGIVKEGLIRDVKYIQIDGKETDLNVYLIKLFKHSPSQLASLLNGLSLNKKLVDRIKKCIDSESFLKLIKKNVQFENAFLAENSTEVDSKDSVDSPVKVDSNALGIVKEGLISDAKYVQINGKETDLNLYLIELFEKSPAQCMDLVRGLSINSKLITRIKSCFELKPFLNLIQKHFQFKYAWLAEEGKVSSTNDSSVSTGSIASDTAEVLREGLTKGIKIIQIDGKEININDCLIDLFEKSPAQLTTLLKGLEANNKLVHRLKACFEFEPFFDKMSASASRNFGNSLLSIQYLHFIVKELKIANKTAHTTDQFWVSSLRMLSAKNTDDELLKAARLTLDVIAENGKSSEYIVEMLNSNNLTLPKSLALVLKALDQKFNYDNLTTRALSKSKELTRCMSLDMMDALTSSMLLSDQIPGWYRSVSKASKEEIYTQILSFWPTTMMDKIKSKRISDTSILKLVKEVKVENIISIIQKQLPHKSHLFGQIKQLIKVFNQIDRKGSRSIHFNSIIGLLILKSWARQDWRWLTPKNIWKALSHEMAAKCSMGRKRIVQLVSKEVHALPKSYKSSFITYKEEKKTAQNTIVEEKEIQKPEILKTESNRNTIMKDGIPIPNAGLVLLNNYFMTLFDRLDLLENGNFIDVKSKQDAVHYLHYLASGRDTSEEEMLSLNKLICGVPISEPLPGFIDISEDQKELIDGLLHAAIGHWRTIGDTSANGFRGNWIVREGLLSELPDKWDLHVEMRSYDLLIGQSPFSFSVIKQDWMPKPIHVQWAY